jgi:hypothetical protein
VGKFGGYIMEILNVLLKEYEIAANRWKVTSDAKTKFISVYLAILTFIISFLFKGKVQPFYYLIFAAVIYVVLSLFSYLSQDHLVSWNSWLITEAKINKFLRDNYGNEKYISLTIGNDILSLKLKYHEKRVVSERLLSVLVIIVSFIVYMYCVILGAIHVGSSLLPKLVIVLTYLVLLILLAVSDNHQNKNRKIRFQECIKKYYK